MSDETNREAEAGTETRTGAAAARLPWAAPKLSCIFAADAQVGTSDDVDLAFQVS
jgi:hypothetical protein